MLSDPAISRVAIETTELASVATIRSVVGLVATERPMCSTMWIMTASPGSACCGRDRKMSRAGPQIDYLGGRTGPYSGPFQDVRGVRGSIKSLENQVFPRTSM